MPPLDLAAFFAPRSIAVIGATERPGSVAAALLRNLLGGSPRAIHAVNPKHATVLGLPSHRSIGEVPGPIDLAIVCTPSSAVTTVVRECGAARVPAVLILSAGFRETGVEGARREADVRRALAESPATRAIGPNCAGILAPPVGLNASFLRGGSRAGGIAFLSQSGALCAAMLGRAADEEFGFSKVVSVGNMIDVGFGDLIERLADDEATKAIVLYVESIVDAPRFLAAARRCLAAGKPIVAYKAGRFPTTARAAASHTGALAGEDIVYDAAFRDAGVVRVGRLDELFGVAESLACAKRPRGTRLAIVTNAGGPGLIAADALIERGGRLAALSPGTIEELNAMLPAHWSRANPVDVIGDAPPARLSGALRCVLADDAVDAALVVLTPQATIDTHAAAEQVAAEATQGTKPVLAAWMGGSLVHDDCALFHASGVATYATPEEAVAAFLYAAPRDGPRATVERDPTAPRRSRLIDGPAGALDALMSKALFAEYGVEANAGVVAADRGAAQAAARACGFPVALKVQARGVTHKSDVGGVELNLRSDAEVGDAFERIAAALRRARPDAALEGVTVERMLDRGAGVELIVGTRRDPTFGPVVLVGAGGVAAEVFEDRAVALAPLDEAGARRLIERLRCQRLLECFRGRPRLDVEALAAVVARVSWLALDHPRVAEAEVNPLLVLPRGAIALDARVILCA